MVFVQLAVCQPVFRHAEAGDSLSPAFLREKSRFCGRPRPFDRQVFSFRLTGRHTCTYFWRGLAAKRDCAPRERARAATAFWPKPQKAAKGLFNPRHQAGGAVTGGDVSRIARNSHRKRRSALPVLVGAESVGRKSFSPHAHGIRPSAVPGKFRQSRNVASSKGWFLRRHERLRIPGGSSHAPERSISFFSRLMIFFSSRDM